MKCKLRRKLFLTGLFGFLFANSSVAAVKIKDNDFCINKNGMTKLEVIYKGSMISEGQEPQEVINLDKIKDTNSELCLRFKAGRNKTKEVANEFNRLTGGAKHLITTQTTTNKSPSELNFYIAIKIIIDNNELDNIYIAQGSNISGNNWWIGSNMADKEKELVTNGTHLKINAGSTYYIINAYAPNLFYITSIK